MAACCARFFDRPGTGTVRSRQRSVMALHARALPCAAMTPLAVVLRWCNGCVLCGPLVSPAPPGSSATRPITHMRRSCMPASGQRRAHTNTHAKREGERETLTSDALLLRPASRLRRPTLQSVTPAMRASYLPAAAPLDARWAVRARAGARCMHTHAHAHHARQALHTTAKRGAGNKNCK